MENNTQLQEILDLTLEMKAENIVAIHTGALSPIADWVIVCEGGSFTHVAAIADRIRKHFKQTMGILPYHMEGADASRWIAIDYTDIVLHVMLPELRNYYKIEELWSEYPQKDVTDEDNSPE